MTRLPFPRLHFLSAILALPVVLGASTALAVGLNPSSDITRSDIFVNKNFPGTATPHIFGRGTDNNLKIAWADRTGESWGAIHWQNIPIYTHPTGYLSSVTVGWDEIYVFYKNDQAGVGDMHRLGNWKAEDRGRPAGRGVLAGPWAVTFEEAGVKKIAVFAIAGDTANLGRLYMLAKVGSVWDTMWTDLGVPSFGAANSIHNAGLTASVQVIGGVAQISAWTVSNTSPPVLAENAGGLRSARTWNNHGAPAGATLGRLDRPSAAVLLNGITRVTTTGVPGGGSQTLFTYNAKSGSNAWLAPGPNGHAVGSTGVLQCNMVSGCDEIVVANIALTGGAGATDIVEEIIYLNDRYNFVSWSGFNNTFARPIAVDPVVSREPGAAMTVERHVVNSAGDLFVYDRVPGQSPAWRSLGHP